jgi:hypothetical protein
VQRHAEGIVFREYNVSGASKRMMWALMNLSGR